MFFRCSLTALNNRRNTKHAEHTKTKTKTKQTTIFPPLIRKFQKVNRRLCLPWTTQCRFREPRRAAVAAARQESNSMATTTTIYKRHALLIETAPTRLLWQITCVSYCFGLEMDKQVYYWSSHTGGNPGRAPVIAPHCPSGTRVTPLEFRRQPAEDVYMWGRGRDYENVRLCGKCQLQVTAFHRLSVRQSSGPSTHHCPVACPTCPKPLPHGPLGKGGVTILISQMSKLRLNE